MNIEIFIPLETACYNLKMQKDECWKIERRFVMLSLASEASRFGKLRWKMKKQRCVKEEEKNFSSCRLESFFLQSQHWFFILKAEMRKVEELWKNLMKSFKLCWNMTWRRYKLIQGPELDEFLKSFSFFPTLLPQLISKQTFELLKTFCFKLHKKNLLLQIIYPKTSSI